MSSILLIGNGSSALDHESGNLIDTYSLVCRFNWFQLKGYEKYVGTKCDVWVTCLDRPYILQRCHLFTKIYFPLHQQKFIDRINEVPNCECFPQKTYKVASMMNGKWFYPSSGLLATTFFLENGYDVILYGFDFFQRSKHHYCDEQPRGDNHSPEMEIIAFTKLIKESRVRLLI